MQLSSEELIFLKDSNSQRKLHPGITDSALIMKTVMTLYVQMGDKIAL